jgi:hypothetical protein
VTDGQTKGPDHVSGVGDVIRAIRAAPSGEFEPVWSHGDDGALAQGSGGPAEGLGFAMCVQRGLVLPLFDQFEAAGYEDVVTDAEADASGIRIRSSGVRASDANESVAVLIGYLVGDDHEDLRCCGGACHGVSSLVQQRRPGRSGSRRAGGLLGGMRLKHPKPQPHPGDNSRELAGNPHRWLY